MGTVPRPAEAPVTSRSLPFRTRTPRSPDALRVPDPGCVRDAARRRARSGRRGETPHPARFPAARTGPGRLRRRPADQVVGRGPAQGSTKHPAELRPARPEASRSGHRRRAAHPPARLPARPRRPGRTRPRTVRPSGRPRERTRLRRTGRRGLARPGGGPRAVARAAALRRTVPGPAHRGPARPGGTAALGDRAADGGEPLTGPASRPSPRTRAADRPPPIQRTPLGTTDARAVPGGPTRRSPHLLRPGPAAAARRTGHRPEHRTRRPAPPDPVYGPGHRRAAARPRIPARGAGGRRAARRDDDVRRPGPGGRPHRAAAPVRAPGHAHRARRGGQDPDRGPDRSRASGRVPRRGAAGGSGTADRPGTARPHGRRGVRHPRSVRPPERRHPRRTTANAERPAASRQLRAPGARRRRPGVPPPAGRARAARPRHHTAGTGYRGGARAGRPAAGGAVRRLRGTRSRPVRGGTAVRGPRDGVGGGVPPDRRQLRCRGTAVPTPGRPAAGHRVGGSTHKRLVGRRDPGPAGQPARRPRERPLGRPVRPAGGWGGPAARPLPAQPARSHLLEPQPVHGRRAGPVGRSFRVHRRVRPRRRRSRLRYRRTAGASGVRRYSRSSPGSWTSRSSR
jgi:hypothetical protein